MARTARMRGRPTLWLPGTDHAGIATQVGQPVPALACDAQVPCSSAPTGVALHSVPRQLARERPSHPPPPPPLKVCPWGRTDQVCKGTFMLALEPSELVFGAAADGG